METLDSRTSDVIAQMREWYATQFVAPAATLGTPSPQLEMLFETLAQAVSLPLPMNCLAALIDGNEVEHIELVRMVVRFAYMIGLGLCPLPPPVSPRRMLETNQNESIIEQLVLNGGFMFPIASKTS